MERIYSSILKNSQKPCQDQTISVWHKLHQLSHLPNLGSGVEVFFKASWALRMLGAWTWRLDHRVTASSHRSYLRISLRLSRKLACIFPKWLWVCTRQSPGSTVKFHKSLHVIELLGSSGQFAAHSDQVTPPRLDGGPVLGSVFPEFRCAQLYRLGLFSHLKCAFDSIQHKRIHLTTP